MTNALTSSSPTSFDAMAVRSKISKMLASGVTLENKELCSLRDQLSQHVKKQDELKQLKKW